MYKVEFT